MMHKKKAHPTIKSGLHPRNKHRKRYDFPLLMDTCPSLIPFVKLNDYEDQTIDFSDPEAVKMLNKALLKQHYSIEWDIPTNYLCPPIPGRADYIHHVADLLNVQGKKAGTDTPIKCLDIGVGANCIYPIIGVKEYGWSFIGTDIDPKAIESANKIIALNPLLKDKIELRLQSNRNDIFYGILKKEEVVDLSICNPPFHASLSAAQSGTTRKLRNLGRQNNQKIKLNFGGQHHELWCKGGEKKFAQDMIRQSKKFAHSCGWFSTLISKKSNLNSVYQAIKNVGAVEVKTIPMGQGNKISRIVAWTFIAHKRISLNI